MTATTTTDSHSGTLAATLTTMALVLCIAGPAAADEEPGDDREAALQTYLDRCVDEPDAEQAIRATAEWDRLVEMGYTPARITALIAGLDDECSYPTLGAAVLGEESGQEALRRPRHRSSRSPYATRMLAHGDRGHPRLVDPPGPTPGTVVWTTFSVIMAGISVLATVGATQSGFIGSGFALLDGIGVISLVVPWGVTLGFTTVALAHWSRCEKEGRLATRDRARPRSGEAVAVAVAPTGFAVRF